MVKTCPFGKMVGGSSLFLLSLSFCYWAENWSLPTEHSGQTQSSGRSSNAVPGSMPFSGSPTAGSYS